MECASKEKVTEQQLARWRREFEAARSFEDQDDEKYWPFKPVEAFKPVTDARVISKNTLPRVAAYQKWDSQGHATQPPRQPKQSMPQQYDPEKHGSWQPLDQARVSDKPPTPAPTVNIDGTEAQKRLEQRPHDAQNHLLPSAATETAHGYLDQETWTGLPYWQRRLVHAQREELRYVASQQTQAAEEHANSTAHARQGSDCSESGHSGSGGELTIQQQLGAGAHYGRNGLVWKATYGGNF